MTRVQRITTALATLLALAAPAAAGLLDSPAPGTRAGGNRVVYRLGPVYYEPGAIDTIVTCTSIAERAMPVTLEIFGEGDTRIGIARADLAPGATRRFVTSAAAGIPEAVAVSALPPLTHGKARVSAATGGLSCTAAHRIHRGDGTAQELALELIKKVAVE
jgi:hypothetical protein